MLSNGYKTNFTALLFWKGKGGAATNIYHSCSHSFMEFIHQLSTKCTQVFASISEYRDAFKCCWAPWGNKACSSKAKGLMVTMATISKNSIICSSIHAGPVGRMVINIPISSLSWIFKQHCWEKGCLKIAPHDCIWRHVLRNTASRAQAHTRTE